MVRMLELCSSPTAVEDRAGWRGVWDRGIRITRLIRTRVGAVGGGNGRLVANAADHVHLMLVE
jgi:hypothetical protein